MRWRLLPAAAGALALSFAVTGCVSKSDMDKMWETGYSVTVGGTTTSYTGLRPWLIHLATAVCQLESKSPGPLDEAKRQCPSGAESQPIPKYPPK